MVLMTFSHRLKKLAVFVSDCGIVLFPSCQALTTRPLAGLFRDWIPFGRERLFTKVTLFRKAAAKINNQIEGCFIEKIGFLGCFAHFRQ